MAPNMRSSSRPNGMFLLDLLALRAQFIGRFGQPRWTIIHGQSMGGHVAIASLELHPEVYQGGLIECGVVDGGRARRLALRLYRSRRVLFRLAVAENPSSGI